MPPPRSQPRVQASAQVLPALVPRPRLIFESQCKAEPRIEGVSTSATRKLSVVEALELCNGSRVEALPGTEATIRAFSAVKLLVVDEAARVPDSLMAGIRPMLAVSSGSLIALSSAWAKQGWFYESWSGAGEWFKVRVTA